MRKLYIITDSHIIAGTDAEKAFFRLLDLIAETEMDILFLGDIFELWVALPGYEQEMHLRFAEWCRKEKERRQIIFMEGNHEFFIRRKYKECFTKLVSACRSINLCDGKLCAIHGDTMNGKDISFQLLRMALRNPFTEMIGILTGKTLGPKFADWVLNGLKGKNLKMKKYFPEKEIRKFSLKKIKTGAEYFVLGHYHCAAVVDKAVILEPWSAPHWRMGVFAPGKGVEVVETKEVFKEKWDIVSE